MMKWRVRREAGSSYSDQEDIRKSLDVLDKVLAEFDDDDGCSDSWHQYSLGWQEAILIGHRKTTSEYDFYSSRNEVSSCASDSIAFKRSNSTHSLDAMHSSAPSTLDQIRKPPVPKRDPATRLSVHENMLFSSSSDIISLREAKRRSYAERTDYTTKPLHEWLSSSRRGEQSLSAGRGDSPNSPFLSNQRKLLARAESDNAITLKSAFDSDRVTAYEENDNQQSSILPSTHMQVQRSPSVAQRRANFEKKAASLNESRRSPDDFRSKSAPKSLGTNNIRPRSPLAKPDDVDLTKSSHESLINIAEGLKSQYSEASGSLREESNVEDSSYQKLDDVPKDVGSNSNDGRIRQLNAKFAEVRHLIRTNQIRPLPSPPPSFTAPPPPKPPRKQLETRNVASNWSLPCDISRLIATQDLKSLPASNLRKTVEDIPKILPADISNMPQLGFSYSMEEDLSPGPKEILSSTPQAKPGSGGGQCLETATKSAFNSSVSSLGYGSSQSDLELNISDSRDEGSNGIHADSLKSQTLPIGMKLSPQDYYRERINRTDCDSLNSFSGLTNNSNNNDNNTQEEPDFRSSSAPPFKLLHEDDKFLSKKSIFGISKKITKDKNDSNDGNSVGKLKTSLDDGVVLRRISNLGEQFPLPADITVIKAAPTEEKKRRSVWRSILRRK